VQLEVVVTDNTTESKVRDLCMKHTNVTRAKRELRRLVSTGHVVFLLLPKMVARASVVHSSPHLTCQLSQRFHCFQMLSALHRLSSYLRLAALPQTVLCHALFHTFAAK
jgi:hypothetical protein